MSDVKFVADGRCDPSALNPEAGKVCRESPPSQAAWWPRVGAVVFAAFLVVLVVWPILTRWSDVEFGRHPDEAGHFITGTMVHDWMARGFVWPPREFARQYFARYPKVAMGHWPPFFHVVQGLWYSVWGVSRFSATALQAAVAALYLVVLFVFLLRRVGSTGAVAATLAVLIDPVFRDSSMMFMADLFVAVLVLGAVWCYTLYLERGGSRPALGFSVCAALAILSKQDAAALAFVPPLCVLMTQRWSLLKDPWFYAPAAAVILAYLPFYWLIASSAPAYNDLVAGSSRFLKIVFLAGGLVLTGWGGWLVTGLGLYVTGVRWVRPTCLGRVPLVLAALATGVVCVHMAMPVPLEPRYKVALLAVAAFCWAVAFQTVSDFFVHRPTVQSLAVIGLAITALIGLPDQQDRRVMGYRRFVTELSDQAGPCVMLVCSDTQGDGAITAEFRLRHPRGSFYVLRADKVLASATWNNTKYQARFHSAGLIESYLLSQPVHLIALDSWRDGSLEHERLLRQVVESDPVRFPRVGIYPVERWQYGRRREGRVELYRVQPNVGKMPAIITLDVSGLPGGEQLVVETDRG
jgi:4-amino-4-deoxy-L-arabinose transferase-like glycosyltransferase